MSNEERSFASLLASVYSEPPEEYSWQLMSSGEHLFPVQEGMLRPVPGQGVEVYRGGEWVPYSREQGELESSDSYTISREIPGDLVFRDPSRIGHLEWNPEPLEPSSSTREQALAYLQERYERASPVGNISRTGAWLSEVLRELGQAFEERLRQQDEREPTRARDWMEIID